MPPTSSGMLVINEAFDSWNKQEGAGLQPLLRDGLNNLASLVISGRQLNPNGPDCDSGKARKSSSRPCARARSDTLRSRRQSTTVAAPHEHRRCARRRCLQL